MLSAPAHIPAITPISLGAGFAAPDLIRDVLIDTFLAMISAKPVCSASPSSGTRPPGTVVGFFDSLPDCGAAVAGGTAHGLEPATFELIDRHCLAAINAWKHIGLPEDAVALLLAQTDLPEPAGQAQAEAIRAEFVAAGATEVIMSTDPVEAEALFAARRLVFQALERRGDPILTEDVCLPRGRLAEKVRVEEIGVRHDTFIANAAHAGDGNLHPLLITPRGDEAAKEAAQAAFAEIIDVALDMGGTVTGEHGVGLLKIDGMRRELGPVVVGMQHAVKPDSYQLVRTVGAGDARERVAEVVGDRVFGGE
jgi:glycolate dehydrogenase FAD-linked subunit